jgi:hypothetical protein
MTTDFLPPRQTGRADFPHPALAWRWEGFLVFLLDLLNRDSIHSRFAAVGTDLRPRLPQCLGVALCMLDIQLA